MNIKKKKNCVLCGMEGVKQKRTHIEDLERLFTRQRHKVLCAAALQQERHLASDQSERAERRKKLARKPAHSFKKTSTNKKKDETMKEKAIRHKKK